jgi:hypothetical protein
MPNVVSSALRSSGPSVGQFRASARDRAEAARVTVIDSESGRLKRLHCDIWVRSRSYLVKLAST